MKSAFRSRRHRNPPQEKLQQEKPFFSKSGDNEDKQPFFRLAGQSEAGVQTKLTVGQPGDAYEREADAVADRIVSGQSQAPVVQRQEIYGIQRATLASPQEDEKLDTAEARMEKDKLIQEKPDLQRAHHPEEEEAVQMQAEEEESLQMQEEEEAVQMQAGEEDELQLQAEEDKLQMKAQEDEL